MITQDCTILELSLNVKNLIIYVDKRLLSAKPNKF
jgi:hypothetical protein